MNRAAQSHSISFSGPMYMVQHTDIRISKLPTSLPKVGTILEKLIPANCDMAA